MRYVMFLRLDITKAETITQQLQRYYSEGWSVVSHCEHDGDYSFVLER